MQLSQELTQLEQTRQRAAQKFEQMRDIAITRLGNLKSEITKLIQLLGKSIYTDRWKIGKNIRSSLSFRTYKTSHTE